LAPITGAHQLSEEEVRRYHPRGLAGGPAAAQETEGALLNYNATVSPMTGCPGIQWRISRMGDTLQGMMWYSDMSGASETRGTVAKDRSVTMTVTPIKGNGPQGTLKGHWTETGTFAADLDGPECSKQHIVFTREATGGHR
jgi:hypothetical protein